MRSGAVAVSLLLVQSMLMAQSPAPGDQVPDQTAPTLKQEVRNVVVDVVVTDKHGKPVHDLPKGDFQVMENGVPQGVAFFEEHDASTAAAQPAAAPLPADMHTNISPVQASGPLVVILLDAMNTGTQQQSYVRAQVIEFLKNLQPGTRLAIFTLSDKLQMVQGFTSDPAVLKAALDGKSYPSFTTLAPGALFGGRVNSVRASLDRFGNGSTSLGQDLRIRYTLDALNAMASYLADIQGRKSLIWFAGNIPWVINPDFSLVTDPTGRVDYGEQLKVLANVMTAGRISIYPIDAHTLATPPGYSPDRAATAGTGGGGDPSTMGPAFHGPATGATADNAVSSGSGFSNREMVSQMNIAGNHMSMSNLAAATGGRAIYNTNGLAGAVAKVETIGTHYYTLAYSPTNKKYDGNLRQIRVKVNQPGLKLEYRRGYYAEDPAKIAKSAQLASSNPLRSVMQRGAPDATEIPFRVEVKQARRQPDPAHPSEWVGNAAATLKGPVVRYTFHWNVDLSGIQFTPIGDSIQQGELDATIYAYDADGKILNNVYATLPLRLSDTDRERFSKSGLPMEQTLDIPVGMVYVRAGILDPSNGHTGATEFPLAVRAGQPSVAGLSAPATQKP